jgi:hypothetical protein
MCNTWITRWSIVGTERCFRVTLRLVVGVWILRFAWILAAQSGFRVPGLILRRASVQRVAKLTKPFQSWRRIPESGTLKYVCVLIILEREGKRYWYCGLRLQIQNSTQDIGPKTYVHVQPDAVDGQLTSSHGLKRSTFQQFMFFSHAMWAHFDVIYVLGRYVFRPGWAILTARLSGNPRKYTEPSCGEAQWKIITQRCSALSLEEFEPIPKGLTNWLRCTPRHKISHNCTAHSSERRDINFMLSNGFYIIQFKKIEI